MSVAIGERKKFSPSLSNYHLLQITVTYNIDDYVNVNSQAGLNHQGVEVLLTAGAFTTASKV